MLGVSFKGLFALKKGGAQQIQISQEQQDKPSSSNLNQLDTHEVQTDHKPVRAHNTVQRICTLHAVSTSCTPSYKAAGLSPLKSLRLYLCH